MKILSIIIIFIVASCNNGSSSSSNSIDSAGITQETIERDATQADSPNVTVRDEKSDTLITVSFPRDSTSTTIQGKLRGVNHPVTFLVPVKQGEELRASLQTEDSAANIRINQIFTPDGKADGPFGKEIKQPIKQEGTYKLIIGENMMQGDEWKGTFLLTISVK